MLEIDKSELPDVIIVRHGRPIWVLLGSISSIFPVVALALWLTPSAPDQHSAWVALFVLVLGLFVWLLLYFGILRTEIVADLDGITRRDFSGQLFVPWHDVIGYRVSDSPSTRGGETIEIDVDGEPNSEGSICYVDTAAGEITFAGRMPGANLLRRAIRERSLNSVAASWRPDDIRVPPGAEIYFSYPPVKIIDRLRAATFCVGYILVFLLLCVLPSLKQNRHSVPMGVDVWFVGTIALITSPLLAPFWVEWRPLQVRRSRAGEKIVVTAESIRWESGARTEELTWAEIVRFTAVPEPWTLETINLETLTSARGQICFSSRAMAGGRSLQRLVQHYLPESASVRIDTFANGLCQQLPNGDLRFHYRNSDNRTALVIVTFLAFIMAFPGLLPLIPGMTDYGFQPLALLPVAIFSPFVLYGWFCYGWSSLVLGDEILEHRCPSGSVRLELKSLRCVRRSGYLLKLESAESHRLLWFGLCDLGSFEKELARRAPWVEFRLNRVDKGENSRE